MRSLFDIKAFWRSGDLFVWLTASGVTISLLMVGGLLGLIMVQGLGQFWPAEIQELRLKDGRMLIGHLVGQESIPNSATPEQPAGHKRMRFRVGNRDLFGSDFRWVEANDIMSQTTPPDVVIIERREWGPVYGRVAALFEGDRPIAHAPAVWPSLESVMRRNEWLHRNIRDVEHEEIGTINSRMESLRLKQRARVLNDSASSRTTDADVREQHMMAELEEEYGKATQRLDELRREVARHHMLVTVSDGRQVRLPLEKVMRVLRPNEMTWLRKSGVYLANLWEFLAGEPREANTEGGIFPAIFGTVMMVLLMTIVVVPFGVMAAVYLREYAKQGLLVQLVRIAVNNLAGVPSIVFGIFGLGFFIYAAGGTIDRLFFPEALPNPTFGTGGILWASLTLALLTVPVVIVATEEGLSAVPREFREGSIGLGATKWETVWHVILPCALPGILTGLILAMARAAGEVAPLMLTGVVKLAPALPIDEVFPYLHLDRKFMHLGFHIYDVGFQSPNVEAAKPMVYMTTLTLIVVVVSLNLIAVVIRNRLRKRYAGSAV